jgi:hypothetical protein
MTKEVSESSERLCSDERKRGRQGFSVLRLFEVKEKGEEKVIGSSKN